ncbi:MAG TPA: NUDIX domain-containing protein [Novosphingobium sp.]|nr:NUDIX domain-containing protein [Novosphingobium sp.]
MPASPAPASPIPAATLVIYRRAASGPAEVLMVQRSAQLRFAGGAVAFPGGRVDAADEALAAELAPPGPAETAGERLAETAARIAAIRETLEETGLLLGLAGPVNAADAAAARALLKREGAFAAVLARHGWRLDLAALVPLARWRGPRPPAYDTRFYLADVGTGAQALSADASETDSLFWASPARTLAMAAEGAVSLVFPTRRNLERLAQFAGFTEARAHAEATPRPLILPREEIRAGEPWLVIPEGLGYPVLGEPLAQARRG